MNPVRFPVSLVLFDYGNVIARVDHSRFFHHLTGAVGEPLKAMVRQFYGQISLGADYESGRLSFAEFQNQLKTALERDFPGLPWPGARTPEAFREAFCDMFENLPETWQLVRDLKPRYRIGLLSNTNNIHFEHVISRIPIFPLFDQITMSWQVGCMKPDPRIFADVVRKFGGPPQEILYLDDIPAYVEAAHNQGFQALLFDPARPQIILEDLRGSLLPR